MCESQKIWKLITICIMLILSVIMTESFRFHSLLLPALITETGIKLCVSKLIDKRPFLASATRFYEKKFTFARFATANGDYLLHVTYRALRELIEACKRWTHTNTKTGRFVFTICWLFIRSPYTYVHYASLEVTGRRFQLRCRPSLGFDAVSS